MIFQMQRVSDYHWLLGNRERKVRNNTTGVYYETCISQHPHTHLYMQKKALKGCKKPSSYVEALMSS